MPLRSESTRVRNGGQKLAQILERGPLALEPALRYALDIASTLRELHDDGRIHGAVDPRHIVIRSPEASLMPVERQGYPDPLDDLYGFGNVLLAMLTGRQDGSEEMRLLPGKPGALKGPVAVRAAAMRLAERCLAAERENAPEFQKIVTEMRLLHVMAKQCSPEAPGMKAVMPAAPPPLSLPMLITSSQSLDVYAGEAPPVINPPFERAARARTGRISPPVPPEVFLDDAVESEPAPAPAEAAPEPAPAAAPEEAEPEPPADPVPTPASRKTERPNDPHSRPFLPEVSCPKCKGYTVRLSRPRTGFERLLNLVGIGVHRCHHCYYRYIPVLGRKIVRKSEAD